MKKKSAFICVAVVLTAISLSCTPKEEKKEVIVVPAQTQTIIREKEPAKKTTTIILDKNGVKVEGKKVDLNIKKN